MGSKAGMEKETLSHKMVLSNSTFGDVSKHRKLCRQWDEPLGTGGAAFRTRLKSQGSCDTQASAAGSSPEAPVPAARRAERELD